MVAAKRNATCIGSKLGQLYVVPLVLVQIQSKSGHSWQGLLCLTAKSWLRCSHISQPGLTQLYSVHHEFTKIWCFNINISQSSDLWDIYLVNPSSILALKPHSNCLRLVLHASINPAKWHVKTCYYFDEFRTFGVMLKQRVSWSL